MVRREGHGKIGIKKKTAYFIHCFQALGREKSPGGARPSGKTA
jgi:hypothetical protein